MQIAHRPQRQTLNGDRAQRLSLDECEQTPAGYGLAESLVTFRGGNGPAAKNRTRQLCLYRDVGPPHGGSSQGLARTLFARGTVQLERNVDRIAIQPKPRDGFHCTTPRRDRYCLRTWKATSRGRLFSSRRWRR